MTQPADQSLLAEDPGAATASPKRRRAPAKPRAKAEPAVESNGNSVDSGAEAAMKPRARRTARKASAEPQEELALDGKSGNGTTVTPSAEPPAAKAPEQPDALPKAGRTARPRRTSRNGAAGAAVTPPRDASSKEVEEWSPARSQPEPAQSPASAPPPSAASEAPAPAAAEAPSPVARKYPVYIPRHVAKQLEEQGQTAPLAVPADAIPEAARAAVEAAQAAQAARVAPAPRPDAPGHHPQHPHHNRGDRSERGDRGDRGDRHRDRGERHRDHDRHDRGERGERVDREAEYVHQEGPLSEEVSIGEGIVEISGKGFGFIRDPKRSFAQHPQDIFVTPEIVRKYNLRDGQWIKGETRRGGRGAQLCKLLEVNGDEPDAARILPAFDELTVVSPMERITLYTTPERTTTRIIDLFAPIGKGQRGIIVAPPRTGKTTLLQHIADAVVKNHQDIKLIILLVDERPEEVTDIKRTVPTAEVMASSNDMDVKSHTRIAQLAIERAKRLVESGKDVFVLLDSITRVGRAFNNAMANGGRTMSGGVDSRALEIPRRLFAAARNTEEAGSLTIVATALIETGSKADELIFQEFKGTGNMELVLDRKISDQRIYPAIDIFQSGTRREELLIPADDLHKIAIIRRGLAGHKPLEAIERLLYFLRKFPSDSQMLREIPG